MGVGAGAQVHHARTDHGRCSWSAVDAFSADLTDIRARILLDNFHPGMDSGGCLGVTRQREWQFLSLHHIANCVRA